MSAEPCPHGDTNCGLVLGEPYHGNCHPWHYHLRARLNGIHGALVGQGNQLAGEMGSAIRFLDESLGGVS